MILSAPWSWMRMRRSNSTTSFQRSHAFFFSRFFIRLMILSAPWS